MIIPAHNEELYLKETLESVTSQTLKPVEIIVVANACSDKTAEIGKKYTPQVYEISEKGAALARNYGAQMASGEILTFLDADTTAHQNTLANIEMAINQRYIGGKARITTNQNKPLFNDLTWKLENWLDEKLFFDMGIPNIFSYTPLVFCRKRDFHELEGFDENLQATEEINLLSKLRKKGKLKFLWDTPVITSSRRPEKQGYVKGGIILPVYRFFSPNCKLIDYGDIR